MAIQYINTGSSANAGNGDSLRSAFVKVNNNFAYLSTASFGGGSGDGYTGSQGYSGSRGYTGSAGISNVNVEVQPASEVGALAFYLTTSTITRASRIKADSGFLYIGDKNSPGFLSGLYIENTLSAEGHGRGFTYANHLEVNESNNFTFYRSRGTPLVPTATVVGDEIVDINFVGHNGTTATYGFNITASIDQVPVGGQQPIRLTFAGNNNAGQILPHMIITSTGTIRMNKLSAIGTSTSIAISTNLIPAQDTRYDLGSTSSQWRSLYVGTSTIYIGGAALSVTPMGEISINGNPVTGSGSPYKLVNGVHEVVLDTNGTLTLPQPPNLSFNDPSIRFGGATSVATNNYGFGVPGPAAGVVYNATTLNLASMKLLVTIEGQEGGGDGLSHTQVCEMLVVRRTGLTVSTVDSVVYGVLHTSLAPLATLTAQLSVDGRVEILAQPTNTATIYVKVHATEVVRGD